MDKQTEGNKSRETIVTFQAETNKWEVLIVYLIFSIFFTIGWCVNHNLDCAENEQFTTKQIGERVIISPIYMPYAVGSVLYSQYQTNAAIKEKLEKSNHLSDCFFIN